MHILGSSSASDRESLAVLSAVWVHEFSNIRRNELEAFSQADACMQSLYSIPYDCLAVNLAQPLIEWEMRERETKRDSDRESRIGQPQLYMCLL